MPPSLARNNQPALASEGRLDLDVAAHLPGLRRTSYALTRNRDDAEDLVQEAYVRALRASNRFRPGSNLKAWLGTILRNLTRNHRRDERRRQLTFDPLTHAETIADVAVSTHPAPDAALLGEVVGPQLRAALEAMPKSLRDTVWLRDVDEMSYAAIAERLRIPIGTVMSRIARGRRQLHDHLVAATHTAPGAHPSRPRASSTRRNTT